MRNLKTLKNKTGTKIKSKLSDILATHEKYKKCYFWTVNNNAAGRRQQEFNNSFSFMIADELYEIKQSLDISCKNFYYRLDIRIDGNKKNVTCIKKLVKKD